MEHPRSDARSDLHPAWRDCGDLRGKRILLVDDERYCRAILTTMLSLMSASVVAVACADEALEALRDHSFDVLLSDIGLEGRSGYELLRAVRALDAPACSIHAVAVTGRVTPEDRAEARDAGFDAHVGKPVDLRALLIAIDHADREELRAIDDDPMLLPKPRVHDLDAGHR
jgi:CheY-like chemotaxis protein